MRNIRAVEIVVLVLMHAVPAAAARTDVVVLLNGDRVTGEVLRLNRGQLQLKTDDAGTVTIEWSKIVSVSTAEQFDVATRDGRRFVGRLDAAAAGMLAVIDAAGAIRVALVPLEIISLAPIHVRFLQKIDGSADVGASYTQASGVAQFSFDGDATYRQASFAAWTRASITLTEEADAPNTGRYSVQVGYARYRPNRWVVSSMALFERNTDLGLNFRGTGIVSVGRYLVQTNRTWLLLGGGGAVGQELPVDAPAATNVDALVTLDASVFAYDFPKTNLDFAVLVFPGLSSLGRVRINTNARIRRELIRNFNVTVAGYDSYDNRPPSTGANTNDVGFSLALGYSF